MTAAKDMFKEKSKEDMVKDYIALKSRFTKLENDWSEVKLHNLEREKELAKLTLVKAQFEMEVEAEVGKQMSKVYQQYLDFVQTMKDILKMKGVQ